jgi:hypothetical protein
LKNDRSPSVGERHLSKIEFHESNYRERTMNKWWTVLGLSVVLFAFGCGPTEVADEKVTDAGDAKGEMDYCGSCGEVAGTDECCAEDAVKCSKCNMTENSPLCCKLDGDFTGKTLCGACGQVKGSDECCAEGADVCDKCQMHEGSPLCCVFSAGSSTAPAPSVDENAAPEAEAAAPEAEAAAPEAEAAAPEAEAAAPEAEAAAPEAEAAAPEAEAAAPEAEAAAPEAEAAAPEAEAAGDKPE